MSSSLVCHKLDLFKGVQSDMEIIRLAEMLCFRFPPLILNVEELLNEALRGRLPARSLNPGCGNAGPARQVTCKKQLVRGQARLKAIEQSMPHARISPRVARMPTCSLERGGQAPRKDLARGRTSRDRAPPRGMRSPDRGAEDPRA